MIIITGAAGFIGSNLVRKLNDAGYNDLVLVDHFTDKQKQKNYRDKSYSKLVERTEFTEWLTHNHRFVQFVFHIGARTDTAEFDQSVFDLLNVNFSKMVWQTCAEYGIPMVYASSAATYGLGEHGFDDSHAIIDQLEPLNPYGVSKNEFDKWAVRQSQQPYFWAGLKFFNVYGPNEYHKGRMASVVYHAHKQIRETGQMQLFRSHNPAYKDGEQKRDFIYVKDVVDVMLFFMHHRKDPGIYNLGSGQARTFLNLTNNTFQAMDLEPNIRFIDTPEDIRDKYQYFTEANMDKLRSVGYDKPFWTLEEGITDYVQNYLQEYRYH